MAGARLLYLTVLLGCGIFYLAYGQWPAAFLLLHLLILPWISLALSIGAIRRFQAVPSVPPVLHPGDSARLWILGSCPGAMPPFRGRLKLRRCLTGEQWRYRGPEGLTDHCGGITVTVEKMRVCDRLGLFAFPVRHRESRTLLVRPRPLAMALPSDPERAAAALWRSKPGGGFSENHELRLYRPGDSLNQIHWKLTAKTGKLTIREAMEPRRGLLLLTLELRGTPEELDRIFGRLLWTGQQLLQRQLPFDIRALTGEGIRSFPVASPEQLDRAVDTLLCSPAAREGSLADRTFTAAWRCHIGGKPDEN